MQTLKGADFPIIPTAVDQGKLSTATLRSQTEAWASKLAAIGVTMDLAPVADTVPSSVGVKNPPIGALYRRVRQRPDPGRRGHLRRRRRGASHRRAHHPQTLPRARPGAGEHRHRHADAVRRTVTTQDPYLGPFVSGMRAGRGVVMISLAAIPQDRPESIAVFSAPIITGLLREQLGFTGMMISDELGDAAVERGAGRPAGGAGVTRSWKWSRSSPSLGRPELRRWARIWRSAVALKSASWVVVSLPCAA